MYQFTIVYAGYAVREYSDNQPSDLSDLFDMMLSENFDLHLRGFDGRDGEVWDDFDDCIGHAIYVESTRTMFLSI